MIQDKRKKMESHPFHVIERREREAETGELILEKDELTGYRLLRPGYILKPDEEESYHPELGMVVHKAR